MPTLVVARMSSAGPVGRQRYEAEVLSRASSSLAGTGATDWQVRDLVVRSLRSPLAGDRRMPVGWLTSAPRRVRSVSGRVLYPRHTVLHRMSLDLPPAGPGEVVTVHDLAWTYPDEPRPVTAAVAELNRAAAVVTVSEFSADECVRHLGIARPHVIPNGVDPRFYDAPPAGADVLATHGIRAPFVLCPGGATRRKNLAALAAAWPRVRPEHPDLSLVLTGPPDPRRTTLFAALDGTVLPGRLPRSFLPSLVAAAACLVVPSLYEGFGLAALEAMAALTPVVASRASSLPEVVGDGGWLVSPDADGLAEGVARVVAGGADVDAATARGRARASHFTWERSAAAHATIWTEVAERRR